MQLVEQHIIDRDDPRFAVIDEAAFKSKNLYNYANYIVRQKFIFEGVYLNYQTMDKLMQSHETYKALPTKVSQQVLMLLHKNWLSFFEACKAYREEPEKFTGQPKLPKYKHKTEGRNILIYTIQALGGARGKGKGALQRGLIQPSGLSITVTTRQNPSTINQVRIVPRHGFYVVEIIYEHEQTKSAVDPALYAGIDIGLDNLAALTSNLPGFVPVLVNGRPVKSVNQFYNKRRAELQSKLGHTGTTKRMERLTNKRNRRIGHYMHTASRWIVEDLVAHGIGTLVVGKNDQWKQEANMGKRNNQNFVGIPHARFISMLSYKAELAGITVILTEESYTSKASFLDCDAMPVYDPHRKEKPTFSGRRIERGLYRAADGTLINADCNGSGNIIRKVAPDAFQQAKGVEDGKGHKPVVHPVRLSFPSRSQKASNGGNKRPRER
jgi:putative transposase